MYLYPVFTVSRREFFHVRCVFPCYPKKPFVSLHVYLCIICLDSYYHHSQSASVLVFVVSLVLFTLVISLFRFPLYFVLFIFIIYTPPPLHLLCVIVFSLCSLCMFLRYIYCVLSCLVCVVYACSSVAFIVLSCLVCVVYVLFDLPVLTLFLCSRSLLYCLCPSVLCSMISWF